MLPPNNALNMHTIGSGLVAPSTTHATSVPQTGWNQEMMKLAEVFDPFIQKSLISQPRFWYNVIPRGQFPNFNGVEHETRIFRGGLQHYAGLQDWDAITVDTAATCVPGGYTVPTYAWEKLSWSGYKRRWGSDPVCLDTMKYIQKAQEQLAWILQVGADYGISLQEVFNRDMLLKFALDNGRQLIMSRDSVTARASAPKFYYDPFVEFGNGAGQVASTTGITAPFIVWKADDEVEPLNFDVLDFLHEDLDVSCPSTALSSSGGENLFGLPVSKYDFERYIRGNDWETKNWRESRSEQLIQGLGKGVKNHRGWAMSFDENQLRFKVTKIVKNYDASVYGDVGTALDGNTVIIAQYVPPRVAGRTGENGIAVPEFNPAYHSAELAIMPTLQKDIFTNLMGSEVASLGSGTFFGPQAGLNGIWKWINIPDPVSNPEGLIGNFRGRFEIFPKPDPSIFFATALLYRRCATPIRALCPVDNAEINPDTGTGAITVSSGTFTAPDTTAKTATLTATLAKTLVGAGPGTPVSVVVAFGGTSETLSGYVIADAGYGANTYVIGITDGIATLVTAPADTDGEYSVATGVLSKYITNALVAGSVVSVTAL